MKMSRYVVTVTFKQWQVPLLLCYHLARGEVLILSANLAPIVMAPNFIVIKNGSNVFLRTETSECELLTKDYQKLVQNGFFVDEQFDEVTAILSENCCAQACNDTLTMVVQVSSDCSCNCSYCGQLHSKINFDDKLAVNLLTRIKQKLHVATPVFKTLEMRWFGGEPLLNLPLILRLSCELQKLAAEYRVGYQATITTNGLVLNLTVLKRLIECRVNKIEITLDGDEETHNLMRPIRTGGPSFNIIYKNLVKAVENYGEQINFTVRCNVDRYNGPAIINLIKRLHNDHLAPKLNLYVAPLHDWGNRADLQGLPVEEFAKFELEVLVLLQKYNFRNAINVLPKLRQNLCMAVAREAECVDPTGAIFHCTEVSLVPNYIRNGRNRYQLATLDDEALFSGVDFRNNYIKILRTKTPCLECQLLPVCGGGCLKSWNEGITPCPSLKFNLRERLLLSYLFNVKGGGVCAKMVGKTISNI